MASWRKLFKKVWHFIWEDNSIWSWIVNIILAFVLIKFIVYPGLGFLLGTTHPVVAVVSESMEHRGSFDDWWEKSLKWYADNGIDKDKFASFKLKNGFDKGDIIVLRGKKPGEIRIGDIIVFWSQGPNPETGRIEPIIHRVVKKSQEGSEYRFNTKGDNYATNEKPIFSKDKYGNLILDETDVREDMIIGNAAFRIPLLGYIKIWFVEFILEPLKELPVLFAQKG